MLLPGSCLDFDKMKRYSYSGYHECTYFIPSIGTQITLTQEDITECIDYITTRLNKHEIEVVAINNNTIYINWKNLLVTKVTEHLNKKKI